MTIEQYAPASPAPIVERNGYDLIRSTALAMADANAIAKAVATTNMVPAHFRNKPDDLTAAILYGASLGFDPMQSARQVYVVHGQAALYARSMVALVMSAGHDVWTVETNDESVTVAGRRRGSDHTETSTWDIARARRAKYTGNEKYSTDPQAMLYAKAASEVCRKIAPDVLNGVYSVEEMQMETVESERIDTTTSASATDRLRAALNPSPAPDDVVSPEPSAARSSSSELATGAAEASAGEGPAEAMFDYRSSWARGTFFPALRAAEKSGHVTDALAFMSEVVGREITSSKELTEEEAHQVHAHLPQVDEIPGAQ